MIWEELNTKRYYKYINSIISERGQWSDTIHSSGECHRHHIRLACYGVESKLIPKNEFNTYKNLGYQKGRKLK